MLDVLPTIGEIAIVITGFSGLIVALRPSILADQGVDGIRVRMLVLQTFLLLFLCFVPFFVHEIPGVEGPAVWSVSCAVMAFSVLPVNVWRAWVYRSAPKGGSGSRLIQLVIGPLYLALIVLCLARLAGYLVGFGQLIYLGGIMLMLLTSCLNFVLLLFTRQATERGA